MNVRGSLPWRPIWCGMTTRKEARRRRHLELLREEAKAAEVVEPPPLDVERAEEAAIARRALDCLAERGSRSAADARGGARLPWRSRRHAGVVGRFGRHDVGASATPTGGSL